MCQPVPNQPSYSSQNLSTAGIELVDFNEDGPLHIGLIFRKAEATEAAVVSEHATSTGSQKTFQGSASLGPALFCPMPDILAHPAPRPGSRLAHSESYYD